MNKSLAALILASLALAGCGANPPKTEGAAPSAGVQDNAKQEGKAEVDKDKRVNCEKYTPIGSNRPKYRCVTTAEKKSNAEASQREMRKMTAPAPSAGGIDN